MDPCQIMDHFKKGSSISQGSTDPEAFMHVSGTRYPLYPHQVWGESDQFWRSYEWKRVLNGDPHVKSKWPPFPQSGSDPDECCPVSTYCHPVWLYQIWNESVHYLRSCDFLKIAQCYEIGIFEDFAIFLWPWPLTLTSENLINCCHLGTLSSHKVSSKSAHKFLR